MHFRPRMNSSPGRPSSSRAPWDSGPPFAVFITLPSVTPSATPATSAMRGVRRRIAAVRRRIAALSRNACAPASVWNRSGSSCARRRTAASARKRAFLRRGAASSPELSSSAAPSSGASTAALSASSITPPRARRRGGRRGGADSLRIPLATLRGATAWGRASGCWPLAAMDAASESEECDECRICRGESTPEQPLSHPCRCSGSMRYVHETCLLHWLALSKARRCEARRAAALRCSDPALTRARCMHALRFAASSFRTGRCTARTRRRACRRTSC
jgi:hypothetical protein